ncbi:MAG TPA: potassium transporter Kup [Methylomirabilota bacterium]|jgi:KUP system potassium uptake protein|nr:potassium transporter Kup [Methylomirabilota bacterium]
MTPIPRPQPGTGNEPPRGRHLAALSLTALGVVYGDIGTSPLYAFRECFKPEYGLAPTADTVLSILSLIVWSLVLIVSVKYIGVMMQADNRGEGGILALLALIARTPRRRTVVVLGLFGAALLYGDGVITPAISVLSAAEGLEVVAPAFQPYVVPTTLALLFLLFLVQKRGTARVGSVFGPIMLVWFTTIAALGVVAIARAPAVLQALNPWYAIRFFADHGLAGALVLGAVVLAVTGAEALYADMGHFGRRPIRLVWLVFVLPALVLNYFGQGALVLTAPEAVSNPFYRLAPRWFLYPLLVIATLATIVASQALISGAFSLTRQAVRLGYCPRVTIVHTSREEAGQIYIPEVNVALMVACLALVVGFGSSSALGAAYGVAVTGTMAITDVLFYVLARQRWRWSAGRAALVAGGFLAVDLAFLATNLVKFADGGWVPLAIGAAVFLLMTTWRRGSELVGRIFAGNSMPLDRFLAEVDRLQPPRVRGTAVFLTAGSEGTPLALVLHLEHNKALHEEIVFLTVTTEEVPEVPDGERVQTRRLGDGLYRVTASYGFMETPDVPAVLRRCCDDGLRAEPDQTTYYLGRARLRPVGPAPMMKWRKLLFGFMARNARSVGEYFGIPPERVVELGAHIEF